MDREQNRNFKEKKNIETQNTQAKAGWQIDRETNRPMDKKKTEGRHKHTNKNIHTDRKKDRQTNRHNRRTDKQNMDRHHRRADRQKMNRQTS